MRLLQVAVAVLVMDRQGLLRLGAKHGADRARARQPPPHVRRLLMTPRPPQQPRPAVQRFRPDTVRRRRTLGDRPEAGLRGTPLMQPQQLAPDRQTLLGIGDDGATRPGHTLREST